MNRAGRRPSRRPLIAAALPGLYDRVVRLRVAWMLLLIAAVLRSQAVAQEEYVLEGEQWTKQAAPDPDTPEGQLQAIRRLLAEDRPKDAQYAADRWMAAHPNHPLYVEALLLHGDALTARGNHYKALFDYERVIRQYPGTEHFKTALERELLIAQRFTQGVKRKVLGFIPFPAMGEAEELYIRTQERAPGTEIGERASLALGDHYFRLGDMALAAEAYDLFLLNYPASLRREYAMLRQIQANLATFRGPQYNATGLLDAAQRIEQYQAEYPIAAEKIGADALRVRISESLASKDYHTARWYESTGRPISAAVLYQRLVRDYPQTAAAESAIQRLGVLGAPIVAMTRPNLSDEPRPDQMPARTPSDALPSEIEAAIERERRRQEQTPEAPQGPVLREPEDDVR